MYPEPWSKDEYQGNLRFDCSPRSPAPACRRKCHSSLRSARILSYNLNIPRVLYTAFDIVPSPKGASTLILHNIRGLVNSQFEVHLFTPNDGVLPPEDTLEGHA
jgi:hypothetical protein